MSKSDPNAPKRLALISSKGTLDWAYPPFILASTASALGYETHSIMCSPAQQGGRVFGALELINKKTGSSFNAEEINLLNYLAHEFADYLINTGQTGD